MSHSANSLPSKYGLYGTYDKRRSAKKTIAEAKPRQVPSILQNINESRKSINESTNEYLVTGVCGGEQWQYRVTAKDETEASSKAQEQAKFKFNRKFVMKNGITTTNVQKTGSGEFEESHRLSALLKRK
ncbi:hypothetical protein [Ralstonia phage RP13]|nr:hypothetical protein [Ralstonia phage RP13]